MPWTINEAGESVWVDDNPAPAQSLDEFYRSFYDEDRGTWDMPGFASAIGVPGAVGTLDAFQKGLASSAAPGAGYTLDKYLNTLYLNPRIVDTPRGKVVAADGPNPAFSGDLGLGESASASAALKQALVGMAGVIAGGMGLEALMAGAGAAGAGAGTAAAAEAGATAAGASGAAAGEIASSVLPTLTEAGAGSGLLSGGVAGSVTEGLIPTLAEISGASSMGLPAGGYGAALAGTGITIPGPLGNLTLDAAGNLISSVAAGGVNFPTTPSAPKTGAPPTTTPGITDKLSDAAIKAGVNLLGGAIAKGIAGDGNPTSTAGLTQAQQAAADAAASMPTEEEAAARAHADVTQAFNTQRGNHIRRLLSYGINPSSGRFASTGLKFNLQEGKTDALSQNIARQGVRNAKLGTAATLAGLQSGLTHTQALIEAANFKREQEIQNQVRQGIAPFVSAVTPAITKGVSNWFNLPAQNGITDAADNIYNPDLVFA